MLERATRLKRMSPRIATFRPFRRAEVLLHGEGVEEPLGRVLVRPVAGVDDGDVEDLAQVVGRAGRGVADDDHVRIERLDVLGGVPEGLALLGRRARRVERDHVRAQALRGHVEGEARARARLEEEVDDRLSPQRGNLLHVPPEDLLEGRRGGMDLLDLAEAELLDRDQVSAGPGHRRRRRPGASGRAPGPRSCRAAGSSPRETITSSFSAALISVPEKSATIGSLRLPRSTSTASSTRAGPPVVEQLVQGGLHGAPAEEDVVDQEDRRPVHVAGEESRGELLGDRMLADVVAVKGDVQVADPLDPEPGADPPGHRDPAIRNPQHQKAIRMRVPGFNGSGKPLYGGVNLAGADGLVRSHCAKYCMPGELR